MFYQAGKGNILYTNINNILYTNINNKRAMKEKIIVF